MPSRDRISRWLGRCLIGVLAHPVLFSLVVALIVAGLANLVLARMHAHLSFGSEAGLEMLILFASVSVPIVLTLTILRAELKTIYVTLNEGPRKAAPILLRFVSEEIKELGEKIADTRSDGIDLEPQVAAIWIRDRCFSVASGNFFATDVLVPSRFLETYSDYLRVHKKYVEESPCSSVRLNLASTRDLLVDSRRNPAAFSRYERWHIDAEVDLLHLEEARAIELAQQCRLRKTRDFALWEGEFALLVKYRRSGETNVRLALVGEPAYERCLSFFEQAQEEARPFHKVREDDLSTARGSRNGHRGSSNGRLLTAMQSRLSERARRSIRSSGP